MASTLPRIWFGKPTSQLDASTLESAHEMRVMSFNMLAQEFAKGAPEGVHFPAPECGSTAPDGLVLVQREACNNNGCLQGSSDENPGEAQTGFRCPQRALEWRLRWPKLRDLLLKQDADLVALQELDLGQDENTWSEVRLAFEAAGYCGRRAKKLERASDGVALFWSSKRLRAVGRPEVWHLHQGSVHVALAQRLVLDERIEFRTVTTHLKAGIKQSAERERYEQVKAIRRQLSTAEPRLPTLMLADLNSHCRRLHGRDGVFVEPLVYEYLNSHGFKSLPKEVIGHEMPFTCWGGWQGFDVGGAFDYILGYEEHLGRQEQIIRPLRVLLSPQVDAIRKVSERLPNQDHPSDHIPVVTDLIMEAKGAPIFEPDAAEQVIEEPLHLELPPEEPEVKEIVEVPKQVLGRVIGRQGQVIKSIRDTSGASKVDASDQSADPCQVRIEGTAAAVDKAKNMMLELIQGFTPGVDGSIEGSRTAGYRRPEVASRSLIGQTSNGHMGRPSNFKTALCKYFEQGHCSRGDSCSFAHGQQELMATSASSCHNNLYVANLPEGFDQSTFRQVFEGHGTIISVHLEAEKRYGFVKFSTRQEADNAIKSLDGLEYDRGVRLQVRYANNPFGNSRPPPHRPIAACLNLDGYH